MRYDESVHWVSCSYCQILMKLEFFLDRRVDEGTDRQTQTERQKNDEADSRFSQFFQKALEKKPNFVSTTNNRETHS